jgi:Gpi18-like mannosyltransferase
MMSALPTLRLPGIRWAGAPATILLVLVAFACRLLVQRENGVMGLDMADWLQWGQTLTQGDWRHFYARTGSDYLPGYLYVLWALTKMQVAFGNLPSFLHWCVPSVDLLYKLPAIASDTATVAVIYQAGRRWATSRVAFLAALTYAVNPGVIFNSSVWGQVDSMPALFMLSALVLLPQSRPLLCGTLLALSIMGKPTAIVLVPLCLLIFLGKRRAKDSLLFLAAATATGALLFFPFVPLDQNPLQFIWHCFVGTSSRYPYLTINAFNLWELDQGKVGFVSDSTALFGLSADMVGWLLLIALSGIVYAALAWRMWKSRELDTRLALPAAGIILLGFFVLLTRMHERHLLPALPAFALSSAVWPRFLLPYLWLSFAYFLNLRFAFYLLLPPFSRDLGNSLISDIGILNLTMLVLTAFLFYKVPRGSPILPDSAGE